MDYSALKTILATYAHRDDSTFTDKIPTFIQLAQARMSRDLDTTLLHKTATLTVTAADTRVSLPSDCLELMSVRVPYSGGYRLVQQHSLFNNSQIFESYGGSSSSVYYYARYGDYLELSPIPESGTTLEIVYKASLANFSADSDTDNVLSTYPNIYIYASMIEVTPWMMDDERVATWGNLYKGEVDAINEVSQRSEWSGAPMQIKSMGVDTP